jgi:hypothetical protein
MGFGPRSKKGNEVNIPQAGHGCHGNVCELGDTGACLWKSYLFFVNSSATLKSDYPEMRVAKLE